MAVRSKLLCISIFTVFLCVESVHRHRRSFIVINISFSAIFLSTSTFCHLGVFFLEPHPSPNILFIYRIVLFYIRYLPQMEKSPENLLQGDKQTSSQCSHWSQIVFGVLLGSFSCQGLTFQICGY